MRFRRTLLMILLGAVSLTSAALVVNGRSPAAPPRDPRLSRPGAPIPAEALERAAERNVDLRSGPAPTPAPTPPPTEHEMRSLQEMAERRARLFSEVTQDLYREDELHELLYNMGDPRRCCVKVNGLDRVYRGVVLTEGVGDDELIKAVALFYDPRVPWSGPGRPPDWLWDGESILYAEASGLVRDVSGRVIEDAKGPLAVLERLRRELRSYPLRAAQRAGRRALRLRDFAGARDVLERACQSGCPPGDETAYVRDLVDCAPGGNGRALERWNAGEPGRLRAERFYDRQRENGDPGGVLASNRGARATLWELVASRREGPSLLRSLRVELDCSPPCDPGEEVRGGPDQRLVLRLSGGPLGASPWEVVDTDGLIPPAGPFGAPSPQASKDRLLAAIGPRVVAVVGRTAFELDLSTRTARPIGPADALFSDGEPTVYLASLRDDGYSWTVSAWDGSGPARLLGSYGFADAAPALDAVWRLRRDGEGVAYEDPLTGRRIPLRRL